MHPFFYGKNRTEVNALFSLSTFILSVLYVVIAVCADWHPVVSVPTCRG